MIAPAHARPYPVARALAASTSAFVPVIRDRIEKAIPPRPKADVFRTDGAWFAIVRFEDATLQDLLLPLRRRP